MKQFYISQITTKDGLVHQGLFFKPKKPASKAILWVHGLSAAFYNDISLYEEMADACDKKGWGFAIFNNRGHDLLAGIRKVDSTTLDGYTYYPGGAGQEVFSECVFDIDAGISFLAEKGFSEIILVGHSTGANKVCYYAATQKNPHVAGVVLSAPMSDRLDASVSPQKRKKDIAFMKKQIEIGKGDEPMFGYHFFPMTANRYISLFQPCSAEDTFDYGDKKPRMTYFSTIQLPLLVALAGKDEHADRPIREIQKVFDTHATSKKYRSVIIPGALHKYNGKEQEVVELLSAWIVSL